MYKSKDRCRPSGSGLSLTYDRSTPASLSQHKQHFVKHRRNEPLVRCRQIRPPISLPLSVSFVLCLGATVSGRFFFFSSLWLIKAEALSSGKSLTFWEGSFLALFVRTEAVCHTFTRLFWDIVISSVRTKNSETCRKISWQKVNLLRFLRVIYLSGSFISARTINTARLQSWRSRPLAQPQVSSCPVQLDDTHLPHPWLSSPSLQLPSWPYTGELVSQEGRADPSGLINHPGC